MIARPSTLWWFLVEPRVEEDLFDLIDRDVMLGDVLNVTVGIVIEIRKSIDA